MKARDNPKYAPKLKELIGVVPSLKQIKQSLKIKEDKENIVYKIIFDVLESYYHDDFS